MSKSLDKHQKKKLNRKEQTSTSLTSHKMDDDNDNNNNDDDTPSVCQGDCYEKYKKHIKKVLFEDNIVRKILKTFHVKSVKDALIGGTYYILHQLALGMMISIIIFSNNLHHLTILFVLIALDGVATTILHDCPVTRLEYKYLGTNMCEHKLLVLRELNIQYHNDQNYEQIIDTILTGGSLIAFKIIMILCIQTFKFYINNKQCIDIPFLRM